MAQLVKAVLKNLQGNRVDGGTHHDIRQQMALDQRYVQLIQLCEGYPQLQDQIAKQYATSHKSPPWWCALRRYERYKGSYFGILKQAGSSLAEYPPRRDDWRDMSLGERAYRLIEYLESND